jgi:hypothetical protein
MDFLPFKDQLVIRRVIPLKNPKLAVKLSINPQLKEPQIALIKRNLTSNDLQVSIFNSSKESMITYNICFILFKRFMFFLKI